jgi:hypothetical protein
MSLLLLSGIVPSLDLSMHGQSATSTSWIITDHRVVLCLLDLGMYHEVPR